MKFHKLVRKLQLLLCSHRAYARDYNGLGDSFIEVCVDCGKVKGQRRRKKLNGNK